MMTASIGKGIVRSVQEDTALVEVGDLDACSDCGARMICGQGQGARKRGMLRARNAIDATVGQVVGLTEYHGTLVRVSFMQYAVPLLGFLLGVFIPYSAGLSIPAIADELVLFSFGLVGLFLGGIFSWKWILRLTNLNKHIFQISAIYREG
ncbi:MAG: SoxR reducing system RseC family protein [Fidelibacterota bacterium]|nr:MAG: SoxR reducing system RseC family protein [Candidatus Neomarinimicrobiota bacterium]